MTLMATFFFLGAAFIFQAIIILDTYGVSLRLIRSNSSATKGLSRRLQSLLQTLQRMRIHLRLYQVGKWAMRIGF